MQSYFLWTTETDQTAQMSRVSLYLNWSHMSEGTFSDVAAQFLNQSEKAIPNPAVSYQPRIKEDRIKNVTDLNAFVLVVNNWLCVCINSKKHESFDRKKKR